MKNCSNPTNPKLLIVVALACEARPILQLLALKKQSMASNFPIYANKDKSIFLIIGGIGKIRAAAAVAFLYGITGAINHSGLLNIGIAGSKNHSVGEAVLANKVIDVDTKTAWYPPTCLLNAARNLKTHALHTHNVVQLEYPTNAMVDMEAAGMFKAASMLFSREYAYCLKIISDSAQDDQLAIDKKYVEQLVYNSLDSINVFIVNLLEFIKRQHMIVAAPAQGPHYEQITTKWHFTQYQQQQLKEYLRRWQALGIMDSPINLLADTASIVAAKQFIERIEAFLEKQVDF